MPCQQGPERQARPLQLRIWSCTVVVKGSKSRLMRAAPQTRLRPSHCNWQDGGLVAACTVPCSTFHLCAMTNRRACVRIQPRVSTLQDRGHKRALPEHRRLKQRLLPCRHLQVPVCSSAACNIGYIQSMSLAATPVSPPRQARTYPARHQCLVHDLISALMVASKRFTLEVCSWAPKLS